MSDYRDGKEVNHANACFDTSITTHTRILGYSLARKGTRKENPSHGQSLLSSHTHTLAMIWDNTLAMIWDIVRDAHT